VTTPLSPEQIETIIQRDKVYVHHSPGPAVPGGGNLLGEPVRSDYVLKMGDQVAVPFYLPLRPPLDNPCWPTYFTATIVAAPEKPNWTEALEAAAAAEPYLQALHTPKPTVEGWQRIIDLLARNPTWRYAKGALPALIFPCPRIGFWRQQVEGLDA
jgi:hypothetical protein